MTKQVILTGLRANNDLTLGNYFGGMLPMVDMAKNKSDEFQVNMFIPDLHSFTTPIDHSQLQAQIMHNAKLFVAAGLPLDNDNIHMYRQSYVPAHSELTWILDCFSSMGEMSRMTQYKIKAKSVDSLDVIEEIQNKFRISLGEIDTYASENVVGAQYMPQVMENYNSLKDGILDQLSLLLDSEKNSIGSTLGLFNYPVLMAADILLYGAEYVPVGDDQTQHLEFTRDIAERMNARFGDLFVVPKPVKEQHKFFGKDQGLRIMDLQTPTKKMSKSDDSGKGVIFLGDDPAVAAKKVMSAATDDKANIAYDKANQPGVSNLLEISALLSDSTPEEIAIDMQQRFSGRYGDFKSVVSEQVEGFLEEFQTRLAAVDDETIMKKLESSEVLMNIQARKTLYGVQQAVGLRPRN